MKITFIKKILIEGSHCKKCIAMIQRLEASEHMCKIDNTVIAQEGDTQSEGYQLAKKHHQENAPFLIIEYDDKKIEVVSAYGDFLRVVLGRPIKQNQSLAKNSHI